MEGTNALPNNFCPNHYRLESGILIGSHQVNICLKLTPPMTFREIRKPADCLMKGLHHWHLYSKYNNINNI